MLPRLGFAELAPQRALSLLQGALVRCGDQQAKAVIQAHDLEFDLGGLTVSRCLAEDVWHSVFCVRCRLSERIGGSANFSAGEHHWPVATALVEPLAKFGRRFGRGSVGGPDVSATAIGA